MRKFYLLVMFMVTSFLHVQAQVTWQPTNGFKGGKLSALQINAATGSIYAAYRYPIVFGNNGSGGRMYKSADDGATWNDISPVNDEREFLAVTFQPGNGSKIFAVANDSFKTIPFAGGLLPVYHSANDGQSWSLMNNSYFPSDDWPTTLAADASGKLYAGRSKYGVGAVGGVDVSADNGATWVGMNNGLTNRKVNALAIGYNGNLFAATDSTTSNTNVVAMYNGSAWTSAGLTGGNCVSLAYHTASQKMYAVVNTPAAGVGRLFVSISGGAWQQLFAATNMSKVVVSPAGDVYVHVIADGIYHSTNGTTNWVLMSNANIPNKNVIHHIATANNNQVYASDWEGVLKNTADNTAWTRLNNPVCSYTNAITSNAIGEILFSNPAGIFSTADGGNTSINQGLQGQSIFAVKGMNDGSVFVSLAGSGTHIYKSANNGHAGSWVASDNGFVGSTATYFAENSAGKKYAGIGWQRQVLTSTNTTGTAWTTNTTLAQSGMPQNTVTTAINVNAQGHIFTGMEAYGVYRSMDGGTTYQWLGFSGGDMSAVAFNTLGDVFVAKAGAVNNSGIFRSTNNGNNWSANLLANAGVVNCMYIAPNNDIYAGTSTGMYYSSNFGQSFVSINNGLPTRNILTLHKGGDNFLYAGTAGWGIYKADINSLLPVKLKLFKGSNIAYKTTLHWETGIEQNIKSIEIENSEDGVHFSKIGAVKPKGSDSKYSFDYSGNLNAYFRLKIIDLNAAYTYSAIIYLNTSCFKNGYRILSNIVTDQIEIIGLSNTDRVIISDMSGRTIQVFNSPQNSKISIQTFSSGVYLLHIVNKGVYKSTLKVVKH